MISWTRPGEYSVYLLMEEKTSYVKRELAARLAPSRRLRATDSGGVYTHEISRNPVDR
jgi:hypothetical protein